MVEAPRSRIVEYYNPRPLILGLCFLWGVAMGFCLFYFAPPKQMLGTDQSRGSTENAVPQAQLSDQERRRLDTPVLAEVDPAPAAPGASVPRFQTMRIEPPMPVLTTEGGLTGRMAQVLNRQPRRPVAAPDPARRPPPMTAPPPIPELMP